MGINQLHTKCKLERDYYKFIRFNLIMEWISDEIYYSKKQNRFLWENKTLDSKNALVMSIFQKMIRQYRRAVWEKKKVDEKS